jgi:hypothetical protein
MLREASAFDELFGGGTTGFKLEATDCTGIDWLDSGTPDTFSQGFD